MASRVAAQAGKPQHILDHCTTEMNVSFAAGERRLCAESMDYKGSTTASHSS